MGSFIRTLREIGLGLPRKKAKTLLFIEQLFHL